MNASLNKVSPRHGFIAICLCSFFIFCLLLSCKKKVSQLLVEPPKLAGFHWGKSVADSADYFVDSGWTLKSPRRKDVVSLEVPYDLQEKEAMQLANLTDKEVPVLAGLELYAKDGNLLVASFFRHDTVERVQNYYEELRSNYELENSFWSAKPQKSVDNLGNNFIKNMDLFESKDLFFVVYHSLMKLKDETLDKGRNYRLEVTIYSKLNQGLSKETLIQRFQ